MTSGAAKVIDTENDLSGRIKAKRGIYTAMVLPAPRGPLTPRLVTQDGELLQYFTENGKILVGYDQAFHEAKAYLALSNKLWVCRAAENALYGASYARIASATGTNASVGRGLSNPEADFDLTTTDGRPFISPQNAVVDGAQDFITVSPALYAALSDTPVVARVTSAGTLPLGLVTATDYWVVKQPAANKVALANSTQNAASGTYIDFTTFGLGVHTLTLTVAIGGQSTSTFTVDLSNDVLTINATTHQWLKTGDIVSFAKGTLSAMPKGLTESTDYYVIKLPGAGKIQVATSAQDATDHKAVDIQETLEGAMTMTVKSIVAESSVEAKALLIYGADPGKYNDDISWDITTFVKDPIAVKEPHAFRLRVYQGNSLKETHICSRLRNAKDGRNRNLYVEDVVKASAFIRVVDNMLVNETVYPKDTPDGERVSLFGGSDGAPVTDSTMIRALNQLADKDKYPLVLVFDGGWATQAYQTAIISLTEQRGDCAFILGSPFEAEAQEDYLNAIVKYKMEELNSVSSQGGMWTSHLLINDTDNSREIYVSPTGHVAGKIAYSWDKFEPWVPVAGNKRGVLNVLGVHRSFTEGQMDLLYDSSINPIRWKAGKGIVIWGQKTLQTRASDLDRMNARLLICCIKPAIKETLEDFLFDNNSIDNDSGTRGFVRAKIDNYMGSVKARGGVYDYRVICDNRNNSEADVENNILRVWLLIKIVKSVEFIPFELGITAYSMDFDLAESLM